MQYFGRFSESTRLLIGLGVRQIGGPSRLLHQPIILVQIARLVSYERDRQIKASRSFCVPQNVFVFEGIRHVIIMESREQSRL